MGGIITRDQGAEGSELHTPEADARVVVNLMRLEEPAHLLEFLIVPEGAKIGFENIPHHNFAVATGVDSTVPGHDEGVP